MRIGALLFTGLFSISLLFGNEVNDAARLLKETKTRRKATVDLKRLARSKNHQISHSAIQALYQEYSQDSPDWLSSLLAPYRQPNSENLTYPRVELLALHCQLLMHAHQETTAKNILSKARDSANGLPKVVAFEATGDCLRIKGSPKSALKMYKDALGIGDAHFKREKISASGELAEAKLLHKEWGRVKKRISGKIKAVEKEIRIDELGLDYVLYEEARKLHEKGKNDEAYAKYSRIINKFGDKNIYSVAADFFRRFCKEGADGDKLSESMQEFVKKDKYGLYRGEAQYEIARQTLLKGHDPKKALKQFDEAIKWCETVKNPVYRPRLLVPPKSRKVSAPPKTFSSIEHNAVVVRAEIPEHALLNRVTADWYLPQVAFNARIGAAACAILQDDWEQAKKYIIPLKGLDPAMSKLHSMGVTNSYFRLLSACSNNYLVFKKDELSRVPKSYQCQMVFADMNYLLQKYDLALGAYEKLLSQAQSERNHEVIPVCMVAIAALNTVQGDLVSAKKQLKTVCSQYKSSRVRGRAEYYLGNTTCRKNLTPALATIAVEHYTNAIRFSKDSAITDASRYALVSKLLYLNKDEEARTCVEGLQGKMKLFAQEKIDQYEKLTNGKD